MLKLEQFIYNYNEILSGEMQSTINNFISDIIARGFKIDKVESYIMENKLCTMIWYVYKGE